MSYQLLSFSLLAFTMLVLTLIIGVAKTKYQYKRIKASLIISFLLVWISISFSISRAFLIEINPKNVDEIEMVVTIIFLFGLSLFVYTNQKYRLNKPKDVAERK